MQPETQDVDYKPNRAERRKRAAIERHREVDARRGKAFMIQYIGKEQRKETLEKKIEDSRKRGEARRTFKKKIGLEHGVNPRRVKLVRPGEYVIR